MEVLGTVDGQPVGSVAANDTFGEVVLGLHQDGADYNFAERQSETGESVAPGQTATIGFWRRRRGQYLIKWLNGGPDSTNLGNWLAATLPHMYGSGATYDGRNGDTYNMNLEGKSNDYVAEAFGFLFKRNK